MTYCRWSSDNWKSDVYCYEDVSGGWTTHVAGRRRVGEIPDDRFKDFVDKKIGIDEYMRLHNEHMDAMSASELVDIGLRHDGAHFNDSTLEQFRDRLIMLRDVGYHVPAYVFDEIAEEMAGSST